MDVDAEHGRPIPEVKLKSAAGTLLSRSLLIAYAHGRQARASIVASDREFHCGVHIVSQRLRSPAAPATQPWRQPLTFTFRKTAGVRFPLRLTKPDYSNAAKRFLRWRKKNWKPPKRR
jgi:hypothetical protein